MFSSIVPTHSILFSVPLLQSIESCSQKGTLGTILARVQAVALCLLTLLDSGTHLICAGAKLPFAVVKLVLDHRSPNLFAERVSFRQIGQHLMMSMRAITLLLDIPCIILHPDRATYYAIRRGICSSSPTALELIKHNWTQYGPRPLKMVVGAGAVLATALIYSKRVLLVGENRTDWLSVVLNSAAFVSGIFLVYVVWRARCKGNGVSPQVSSVVELPHSSLESASLDFSYVTPQKTPVERNPDAIGESFLKRFGYNPLNLAVKLNFSPLNADVTSPEKGVEDDDATSPERGAEADGAMSPEKCLAAVNVMSPLGHLLTALKSPGQHEKDDDDTNDVQRLGQVADLILMRITARKCAGGLKEGDLGPDSGT